MERALKGDERCTLDCMRLADLILLLLFEGRQALNRVGCAQGQLVPRVVRRADSSERTHRQLIDCKFRVVCVRSYFKLNFLINFLKVYAAKIPKL